MTKQWFLVGPTASGKTATALEVARLLPVEIVSLDSMSVYRDMDIGTAKPPEAARCRVPHHLLDVVGPDESFSVGRYRREAERAVEQIVSRGHRPLFVGGTPLYLKAMTHGLFDAPAADPGLRERLHQQADRQGTQALHARLAKVDPEAARRIHPNDLKRIVRALEVFETTGEPISALQREWASQDGETKDKIACIFWDRRELYRRIDSRVERMFAAGLVDEVRGLLRRYGRLGRQASQALGYKEVLAHLAGERDLAETMELVKRNTRRMAKRQLTWFRGFDGIRWFEMTGKTSPAVLAGAVAAMFAGASEPPDAKA